MNVTLSHYLIIGIILFSTGVFLVISKKNAIMMLLGIEFIFNAANINFVAFNHYNPSPILDGISFSLFVIVIAAIETVVALAILVQVYLQYQSIDLDKTL